MRYTGNFKARLIRFRYEFTCVFTKVQNRITGFRYKFTCVYAKVQNLITRFRYKFTCVYTKVQNRVDRTRRPIDGNTRGIPERILHLLLPRNHPFGGPGHAQRGQLSAGEDGCRDSAASSCSQLIGYGMFLQPSHHWS